MRRIRVVLGAVAVVAGLGLGLPGRARATMDLQKKAKAAGFAEATTCLYCHNEKLPKKGAATNNERGKWLAEQKEKKGAKDIDVAWLKDYARAKK